MVWYEQISEAFYKRAGQFLLHRYLGQFLKEKLSLEQLTIDLYKGLASIRDVNVDTEAVNELLESGGIPLTMIDGYVGSISLDVPWNQLLEESSQLEINGLEITLQPKPRPKVDMVGSMFTSMMSGMTTSVELARSVVSGDTATLVSEKGIGTEEPKGAMEGIESFAEMIESVLQRVKVTVTDVVIRIEQFHGSDQKMGTALEFRIDKIQYMDERLQQASNKADEPPADPITTQPHSIYSIPDLNKIFTIMGIRLYTDIFTRPDLLTSQAMAAHQQNHQRQLSPPLKANDIFASTKDDIGISDRKTSEESHGSSGDNGNGNGNGGSMSESVRFGLKSGGSPRSDGYATPVAASMIASTIQLRRMGGAESLGMTPSSSPSEPTIVSKPIKFGEFVGKSQFVKLLLRNEGQQCEGGRLAIDLDFHLGALHLLLIPTQVHLIGHLVDALVLQEAPAEEMIVNRGYRGKPMTEEDMRRIEADLQAELCDNPTPPADLWRTDLKTGNWSGEQQFYPLPSRKHKRSQSPIGRYSDNCVEDNFTSISINSIHNGSTVGAGQHSPGASRKCVDHKLSSTATSDVLHFRRRDKLRSEDANPDTTHVKLQLAGITAVICHTDCQGLRFDGAGTGAQYACLVNSLLELSDGYFEEIKSFMFASGGSLVGARNRLSGMLSNNHLQFIGTPVTLDYSEQKFMPPGSSEAQFDVNLAVSATYCELVECLYHESDKSSKVAGFTPIMIFDGELSAKSPALRASFCSSFTSKVPIIKLKFNRCHSELDLSLFDRLYEIFACQPIFTSLRCSQRNEPKGLQDDIFVPIAAYASPVSSPTLNVSFKTWTVDLKFPIADLRPVAQRTHWKTKHSRSEYLRLKLSDSSLTISLVPDLATIGSVSICAAFITGWFCNIDGKNVPLKFLHGAAHDANNLCRLDLSWNNVNPSLLEEFVPRDLMEQSMSPNGIKVEVKKQEPGPFSKKNVLHENEELLIIGEKHELKEFSRSCESNTAFCIRLTVPSLNVWIPSKKFYELLYNRIVNDLAMWEPTAPLVYLKGLNGATGADSIHVNFMSTYSDPSSVFKLCKSSNQNVLNESMMSESMLESSMYGGGPTDVRRKTSKNGLVFRLNSNSANVVLGLNPADIDENLSRQNLVHFDLSQVEVSVVSAFEGDPDLLFFYMKTSSASVKHGDMDGIMPDFDVQQSDFPAQSLGQSLVCMAETTPGDCMLNSLGLQEDFDCFSVALKSLHNVDALIKTCIVAIGIRNITMHQHWKHNWIAELIQFFDVVDYDIEGYAQPKVCTELHVHCWQCALQFCPESCGVLGKLYIDSLDVSSVLVQLAATTRLHFILEDIALFIAQVGVDRRSSSGEDDGVQHVKLKEMVCVLQMGLLDIVTSLAEICNVPDRKEPNFELKIKNDKLELRTCADSMAALIRLLTGLARDAKGQMEAKPTSQRSSASPTLIQSNNSSHETSANLQPEKEVVQGRTGLPASNPIDVAKRSNSECASSSPHQSVETRLVDLVNDAMEDVDDSASVKKPVVKNSRHAKKIDEEFCVMDKPKRSIKQKRGAHCVAAGDEPIAILENYFTLPQVKLDQFTHVPEGWAVPLLRYLIRDISVSWSVYGGEDFGELHSKRPYSAARLPNSQIRQRFSEARRSLLTAGGPGRDHSVCLQIILNKISFGFDSFPDDHSPLSRQLLSIQDIEIRDYLALSKINKFLYRYVMENQEYSADFPMVSLKSNLQLPTPDAEAPLTECSLKISLLPVRLNIDQDALEFIQDFTSDVSNLLASDLPSAGRKKRTSSNDLPVTRIGDECILDDGASLVSVTGSAIDSEVHPDEPVPSNVSGSKSLRPGPRSDALECGLGHQEAWAQNPSSSTSSASPSTSSSASSGRPTPMPRGCNKSEFSPGGISDGKLNRQSSSQPPCDENETNFVITDETDVDFYSNTENALTKPSKDVASLEKDSEIFTKSEKDSERGMHKKKKRRSADLKNSDSNSAGKLRSKRISSDSGSENSSDPPDLFDVPTPPVAEAVDTNRSLVTGGATGSREPVAQQDRKGHIGNSYNDERDSHQDAVKTTSGWAVEDISDLLKESMNVGKGSSDADDVEEEDAGGQDSLTEFAAPSAVELSRAIEDALQSSSEEFSLTSSKSTKLASLPIPVSRTRRITPKTPANTPIPKPGIQSPSDLISWDSGAVLDTSDTKSNAISTINHDMTSHSVVSRREKGQTMASSKLDTGSPSGSKATMVAVSQDFVSQPLSSLSSDAEFMSCEHKQIFGSFDEIENSSLPLSSSDSASLLKNLAMDGLHEATKAGENIADLAVKTVVDDHESKELVEIRETGTGERGIIHKSEDVIADSDQIGLPNAGSMKKNGRKSNKSSNCSVKFTKGDEDQASEACFSVDVPSRESVEAATALFGTEQFDISLQRKKTDKTVHDPVLSVPGAEKEDEGSDDIIIPPRENAVCSVRSDERLIYYKSFKFSPDLIIRLDYHGKRVNMSAGAIQGLLIGLGQLHHTELRLKELRTRQGFLGHEKLLDYALNEWLKDIKRNQLSQIIGGVGPMYCLTQLAQGFRDLFWLPVEEYRREGYVIRGLRKGAHSFTVSTAAATLDLAQGMVGTIQGVAEFAYDMITPSYPQPMNAVAVFRGLRQPADMREGVTMACETVKQGIVERSEAVSRAMQEEHARGHWPARGVIRQAVPTVIKVPAVVAAASGQILEGVRNQLCPEARRDEMDKWK